MSRPGCGHPPVELTDDEKRRIYAENQRSTRMFGQQEDASVRRLRYALEDLWDRLSVEQIRELPRDVLATCLNNHLWIASGVA